MSKEVKAPSQPLVIALLQSLPQLPPVPRLQYTAALLLGDFANWMAVTMDQGQLSDTMPQLLQMLTSGEMLLMPRIVLFSLVVAVKSGWQTGNCEAEIDMSKIISSSLL